MKYLAASLILALSSCVTVTETLPDGTVRKTTAPDAASVAAANAALETIYKNGGK